MHELQKRGGEITASVAAAMATARNTADRAFNRAQGLRQSPRARHYEMPSQRHRQRRPQSERVERETARAVHGYAIPNFRAGSKEKPLLHNATLRSLLTSLFVAWQRCLPKDIGQQADGTNAPERGGAI